MSSESPIGHRRCDATPPVNRPAWVATFSLLDVGGTISSSQLRRLAAAIAMMSQLILRAFLDRSKVRTGVF